MAASGSSDLPFSTAHLLTAVFRLAALRGRDVAHKTRQPPSPPEQPMPRDLDLLQSVFGFDRFRPGQGEIVAAVTAGENTLAIMPTGGGKSLCFQLPALLRDGVTLVISPLIALMRDQVRSLKAAGVEAGALTSGNTEEETDEVFAALSEGRLKLLYMAPERLASGSTLPCSMGPASSSPSTGPLREPVGPISARLPAHRRAAPGAGRAARRLHRDRRCRDRDEIVELFDGAGQMTFLRGRPAQHPPRLRGQGQPARPDPRLRRRPRAVQHRLHRDPGQDRDAGQALTEAKDTAPPPTMRQGRCAARGRAPVPAGRRADRGRHRRLRHGHRQARHPLGGPSTCRNRSRLLRNRSRRARSAPADTLTLFGPDDIRLRRAQIDEGGAGRIAPPTTDGSTRCWVSPRPTAAAARRCSAISARTPSLAAVRHLPEPARDLRRHRAGMKALSAALRTGELRRGASIDILTGGETGKTRARRHRKLPTGPSARTCQTRVAGDYFAR